MSRGDLFGDSLAAIQQAKRASILSGAYSGVQPPKLITGNFIRPLGYNGTGTGLTTTATRCYYFPLPIFETRSFQGASVINTGAGDNGEKIRLMVFRDDATNGGPGTLEKDFGEITLTAAVAVRTLSSAWSAKMGMYWGAVWHETSAAMSAMMPYITNAAASAFTTSINLLNFTGDFAPFDQRSIVCALYVDTAYGAAPASAVAPTASLTTNSPGVDTGIVPAFWLKV